MNSTANSDADAIRALLTTWAHIDVPDYGTAPNTPGGHA